MAAWKGDVGREGPTTLENPTASDISTGPLDSGQETEGRPDVTVQTEVRTWRVRRWSHNQGTPNGGRILSCGTLVGQERGKSVTGERGRGEESNRVRGKTGVNKAGETRTEPRSSGGCADH